MKSMLSIVIPAHNEEAVLPRTLRSINNALKKDGLHHEIVVVDDQSTDDTWKVLNELQVSIKELRPVRNPGQNGFGRAIAYGLSQYSGDRVTIMMADLSDAPEDLIRFDKALQEHDVDCIFGSRAMKGAHVEGYPRRKWMMNRLANLFLCVVFQYRYNDTTNPFKLYKRRVMDRVLPLNSRGFELEIELPLKAMVRGATYMVVSNNWYGRTAGESKMRLTGLFAPYLKVVWACLLERWSGGQKQT
jgi:dolichol-phosphate mannosyltransferase